MTTGNSRKAATVGKRTTNTELAPENEGMLAKVNNNIWGGQL
jgi:hypothetical protein